MYLANWPTSTPRAHYLSCDMKALKLATVTETNVLRLGYDMSSTDAKYG